VRTVSAAKGTHSVPYGPLAPADSLRIGWLKQTFYVKRYAVNYPELRLFLSRIAGTGLNARLAYGFFRFSGILPSKIYVRYRTDNEQFYTYSEYAIHDAQL
jgi:hypothetical protein